MRTGFHLNVFFRNKLALIILIMGGLLSTIDVAAQSTVLALVVTPRTGVQAPVGESLTVNVLVGGENEAFGAVIIGFSNGIGTSYATPIQSTCRSIPLTPGTSWEQPITTTIPASQAPAYLQYTVWAVYSSQYLGSTACPIQSAPGLSFSYGVQWVDGTTQDPDRDGDGVPDSRDECPDQGDLGHGVRENGCPYPSPTLAPVISGVDVAPTIELGQRPRIIFDVTNPNSFPIDTRTILPMTTNIPSQFSPTGMVDRFEDPLDFFNYSLAGNMTKEFSAVMSMRWNWIRADTPIIDQCADQTLESFALSLALAFAKDGAEFLKLKGTLSPVALRLANGYSNLYDAYQAWKQLTDNLQYMYGLATFSDYVLPAGSFVITPTTNEIAGSPRTITVIVPMDKQMSLLFGTTSFGYSMAASQLVGQIVDLANSLPVDPLPWWAGTAVAYVEGMAAVLSCAPVVHAYAYIPDGEIVPPPSVSADAGLTASRFAVSDMPDPREQVANILESLMNLSSLIANTGYAIGDNPNPGQLRQLNRDVQTAIDLIRADVSALSVYLMTFESDYGYLLSALSDLDLQLSILSETFASGEPGRIMCLAVVPTGSPITGSGEIHGTDGNDVIIGSQFDDIIFGHGGNDCIIAGNGQDIVYGGDGNDILLGENGSDELYGEQGLDRLYGGNGPDILSGGPGYDVLSGENGPDTFIDEDEASTDAETEDSDQTSNASSSGTNNGSTPDTASTMTELQEVHRPTCESGNSLAIIIGQTELARNPDTVCIYRTNAANISLRSVPLADPAVGNHGFIQAVDITGWIGTPVEICMEGQGGLIFSDAATTPRNPQWIESVIRGSMTCGTVTSPGTLNLVQNNEFTGSSSDNPNTTVWQLSQCRVTTLDIVNFRAEHSVSGSVLGLIPYNVELQAIAHTSDWYNVIWGDNNGWIHKTLVTPGGQCGQ